MAVDGNTQLRPRILEQRVIGPRHLDLDLEALSSTLQLLTECRHFLPGLGELRLRHVVPGLKRGRRGAHPSLSRAAQCGVRRTQILVGLCQRVE
ncbi:hypothetical protein GKE82_18580 [Conexibacter sp. W3-3-2]|uniref:hypothetical protein n=1 Tax=Conexibacter sp. W3-3-2 TaxID=2675227 RepID=UPI0012B96960|nr:hypothetical protein [Conexibacter sp. W3-3-2]MTD46239.1 hypothetical protein [Conexibacter sp. W3-3-2]